MPLFLKKLLLPLLTATFVLGGVLFVVPNVSFAASHTTTPTESPKTPPPPPKAPVETGDFSFGASASDSGKFLLDSLKCGAFSWTGCIQSLLLLPVYIAHLVAGFLMMLAGMMFDYSLMLSIKKDFINQDFVTSSWTIVRDFSNMIFIFILIYTGVQTILGLGNWRSTVLNVVIMALLINFSLFFTKVVIDAGNILAVGVYEALGSPPGAGKPNEISGALVGTFQPQNFVVLASSGSSMGQTIMVFAVSITVSLAIAWVFFMISLVFFGRILAFWFLMIVSPFAFISIAMPKGNIFEWWTDTLLKQTFIAPIFLFMMYIIMQIVMANPLKNYMTASASGAGGLADNILMPVLVATLLVVALLKTKDFVTKMAGDFGSLGARVAGTALGLAAGVATGGAAMAGQKFIGGYAAKKLAGGELKEGSWQHKLATGATRASFDVRSLAGEKSILGKTIGKQISKAGGSLGVDVGKATLGGVEKAEKTRIEKELDKAKKSEMSIFEEQGAHAREARQKEVVKVAEEAGETARKAHESSPTGQLVAEKTAVVESSRVTAEEAKKKTEEAQKAADAMRNSGMSDQRVNKALEDARKAEEAALDNLYREESNLIAAESTHAASSTAAALKTATDAVEEARANVVSAEKTIKDTRETRREYNATKADKAGRHATAAKIRKGEESGQAKTAKRLAAEKKKEEEREGGARPDVIASIKEKIEENEKKE